MMGSILHQVKTFIVQGRLFIIMGNGVRTTPYHIEKLKAVDFLS